MRALGDVSSSKGRFPAVRRIIAAQRRGQQRDQNGPCACTRTSSSQPLALSLRSSIRRIRFHSPDWTRRDDSEVSRAASGWAAALVPLTPLAVELAPAVDVDAMGANADMTRDQGVWTETRTISDALDWSLQRPSVEVESSAQRVGQGRTNSCAPAVCQARHVDGMRERNAVAFRARRFERRRYINEDRIANRLHRRWRGSNGSAWTERERRWTKPDE